MSDKGLEELISKIVTESVQKDVEATKERDENLGVPESFTSQVKFVLKAREF